MGLVHNFVELILLLVDVDSLDELRNLHPSFTTVIRLQSAKEIEMFIQGENSDAAVLGFFRFPNYGIELELYKEVKMNETFCQTIGLIL